MIKKPLSIDELVYPFIHDQDLRTDYEVLTDELTARVGEILDDLDPELFAEIIADLEKIQPMIYHLNGSIRGKLAVSQEDKQWLLQRYNAYKELTRDCINGFVLPRGARPVGQLHLAKCSCKKVIRLLVTMQHSGIEFSDLIAPIFNILGNLFFVLSVRIKQLRKEPEYPFVSKSY